MEDEYINEYSVRVFRDRKTLKITREYWNLKDGPPSRIGGPAYQDFDPVSGKPIKETYYLEGAIHRREEEGPACRQWDRETGNLVYEAYYQHGECNRTGGKPAIIEYDPKTGKIKRQSFYIDGEEIDPETGETVWVTRDNEGPSHL